MAVSFLDLVNEALVRIGAAPVGSLAEFSAQSLAASTVAENVTQSMIADHPWAFALREKPLGEIVVADVDRRWQAFERVYQVPNDCLRVVGLSSGSPYQLAGDQIYTSCRHAELVYIAETAPSTWPAYFRQALVYELAAAFAISVTDSANRAQLFYREAQQYKRRARALDSQQVPPRVFDLMRIYTQTPQNPLVS
jgi:hypothetical protein